ncbi:T9SS type A sorting domain-containing protein [Candidatus Kapabacteria bacterium]|nr:T9SS type A sorting domain-containing protein [Candidatus Kapabacteria bacterium]
MKKILLLLFAINISLLANFDVGKIPSPFINGLIDLEKGPSGVIWGASWGGGVYRSTDNSDNFTNVSTGLGNLWVNQVKYGDGVLLAATYSGIYKSTNDGDTWTDINSGIDLTTPLTCSVIKDANTYFAGSQGDGIYRSTDAGATWLLVNSGLDFRDIVFLYVTPIGEILAATKGDGLYKSEDNGDTWIRKNSGLYSNYVTHIEEDGDGVVWASTAGEGMFQTDEETDFWSPYIDTDLRDKNITSFTLFEFDGAYFPIVSTRSLGVWRFNPIQAALLWEPWDYVRSGVDDIVSYDDGKYVITDHSTGTLKTKPENDEFRFSGISIVTNDILEIETNGKFVYVGTKDGLIISSDNGRTFQNTSILSEINDLTIDGDNIFVITDGNQKAWFSSDNAENFTELTVDLDEYPSTSDTDKFYNFRLAESVGDKIFLYFSLSYEWNQTPNEPPEGWVPPASVFQIFEASKQNLTWAKTTLSIEQEPIDLDVATNNDIYITFPRDSIYLQNGGTGNYQRIDFNFSTLNGLTTAEPVGVNGLLVGMRDSVLFFNKGTGRLLGYDFPQRSLQGVVPQDRVNSISIVSPSEFYVGFNNPTGLYRTTNGGGSWDSLNQHFVVPEIDDLATNSDGDVYFGRTHIYRYINPDELDPPLQVNLENNTANVAVDINDAEGRVEPIFTWDEEPKADMYHINISKSESFAGKVSDIVYDENSHTINSILEGSTVYYWRVRSRANDVYSDWSPVWTFTTELSVPELVYPINDQVGVSLNASMTWNEVTLATSYDVQISEDETLQNLVFESSLIEETSIEAENLENFKTYVWRVRANNGDAKGRWSEFESFTTIPGSPLLVYPENEELGIPTSIDFRFNGIDGGEQYYIQLSQDPMMDDPSKYLLDREADTDSTHFFDFLEFNETYFWRMRSLVVGDEDGTNVSYFGNWTDIFTFTTGAEAPDLLAPDCDVTSLDPSNIQLRWDPVDDGEEYEVQVSIDPDFGDFVTNVTQPELLLDLTDLDGFTFYYWRVRAYIDELPGAWSETCSFRTWINGPETTFPECGVVGLNPSDARLVWKTVEGGNTYEVEVSELSNFDNPLQNIPDINSDRVDILDLETDKTYYWRVRGRNTGTTELGQWSEVCNFTTATNSIDKLIPSSEISLYPNPAKHDFSLSFLATEAQKISINIISVDGKIASTLFDGYIEQGANMIKFETDMFNSGKYLIEISSDKGKVYKDLIIQK